MLTTEQIRRPLSDAEALQLLLDNLASLGFHVGSWAPGSVQRTMHTAIARCIADLTELQRGFIEFTLNEYSSGEPLAELSANVFDNETHGAVKTRGPMTLTNTGTSAHTIEPGALIVTTPTGVRYTNLTGGELHTPGQLTVTVEASAAGAAGNIPNGTALSLVTSLAGVTVSNGSALQPTPIWYEIAGSDPERDDLLRTRNRTKWATFGIELIGDGYVNLALSVAGIDKVTLDDKNPRGPGTIDVYVAGVGGLAGLEQKQQLQAMFANRVFGTDAGYPPAPESYVAVRDVTTQTIHPNGTVYHDPSHSSADIAAAVRAALDTYVRALPLGGLDLRPGPANVIPLGDLYETIEQVRGVRTVKLTYPIEDIPVAGAGLVLSPVGWPGLTFVPTIR